MPFLHISNVRLAGISACVPKNIIEISSYRGFTAEEAGKFVASTGIERRRIAENTTSSDLCLQAAEQLLSDLVWSRNEIDCLIFVTQTPDFILPATSILLKKRLELNEDVFTLDISLGCSGWVSGLQVISSLISHGQFKKGLLLVGDTIVKSCSIEDKSTYPLFGDAGTASAIEFEHGAIGFSFHTASDGEGHKAIIIPDGGYRNPIKPSSFELIEIEHGIKRNRMHIILDGMNVFSFGITKAPESIKLLAERYGINLELIDFYLFHQANLFMNETIRKKMKIPVEKVPYSLKNFGNTSSASIPLTMVTELSNKLQSKKCNIIACGFGVGLSWGSVNFRTENLVVSELVEY